MGSQEKLRGKLIRMGNEGFKWVRKGWRGWEEG
jgi:hypothetical protein